MINKVSRNDMRKERHTRIRKSLTGTAKRPRLNGCGRRYIFRRCRYLPMQ